MWRLRGQSTGPLFRGTLSQNFKVLFQRAAERLEDAGLQSHMEQATTLWLRHTAGIQLLDAGASVRFLWKLLGHTNQAITSSNGSVDVLLFIGELVRVVSRTKRFSDISELEMQLIITQ